MAVNFFKKWWVCIFIACQPVLDVLAFWTKSESGTVAGLIRLAMMAAILLYVLKKYRTKRLLIVLSLTALVFLMHILNGFRTGYVSPFSDINYLAKVAYLPVIAICLCSVCVNEECRDTIIRGILIAAAIEGIALAFSLISGTFNSTYGNNLGISGWVIDSNRCCQSIIICFTTVFVSLYAAKTEKEYVKIALMLLVFAVLIMNGTSSCYLTLLSLTAGFPIFLLFRSAALKNSIIPIERKTCIVFTCFFAAAILIYPYTPRYKMDELEKQSYGGSEAELVAEMRELGYDIYNMTYSEKMDDPIVHDKLVEYYYGFIYGTVDDLVNYDIDRILSSYNATISAETLGNTRLMKRLLASYLFEDSDMLTRIAGFEIVKIGENDLENDWHAIFYYYGYLGLILYVLAAVYILFRICRFVTDNFNSALTLQNFTLLFSFALLLGLAHFSGALFRRPNSSVYLAVVVALIFSQTKTEAAIRKKRKN